MSEVKFFGEVGLAASLLQRRGLNRLRFQAAAQLLERGAALIDETGRGRLGGARLLLAVQAARATHTFEAVIALCQVGRGVQASMLNRSLLEDALDVHWVAAHPEKAPELADQHDRLINLAERGAMLNFGREATPLSDDEQTELDRLTRAYDNFRIGWNRATARERRDLIKRRWGNEADEGFDFVYDLIQRQNNTLLHGSPSAYRQTMALDEEGRPRLINRIGPDRRWPDSLQHGGLAYYLVCRVLAEEFALDKRPVAEAFQQITRYVREIPAGELEAVGPAGECPCGSGLAAKECHGS